MRSGIRCAELIVLIQARACRNFPTAAQEPGYILLCRHCAVITPRDGYKGVRVTLKVL